MRPLAQVSLDKQARHDDVSFSYPSYLATSVTGETAPEVAPDPNIFPQQPSPEHTVFTFNGYHERLGIPPPCSGCEIFEPTIEVFPVDAYKAILQDNWNNVNGLLGPGPGQNLDYLQSLLARRPDPAGLSAEDPEYSDNPDNAVPGLLPQINAGGAFIVKRQYVDFLTGAGLRYIAFYSQASVEIDYVYYVFQGLSQDGKYFVSAMIPVTAPILPAAGQSESEARAFFDSIGAQLDELPDGQYSPSLGLLDELFGSLSTDPGIVGIPTATPMPPTDTPTPDPPTPTPTPQPGAENLPVVLVHGWKGLVPGQPCTEPEADFSYESNGDFGDLGQDLVVNHHYRVVYARLETSPCSTPRVEENVARLKGAITEALRGTSHTKVILIAHSMGGLVSRAYIEDTTGGYRGDVAELFTFGTPHLGVNISTELWATMFADECMTMASYLSRQAVLEDFKEDVRSKFNEEHPRNKDVIYHLISGNAPLNGRGTTGKIMDSVFGAIANDGIVPLQSGTGLPGEMDRLTVSEVHALSVGKFDYFVKGTKSYECIQRVLMDKTSDTCGAVSSATAVPLQAPQPRKSVRDYVQLVAEYETGALVCATVFRVELGRALRMTAREVAISLAQYALKSGKYVGETLIMWARKAAMSTKDFVAMVADYALERGKEAAGEVARMLGEWAEQAKLNASEMYTLTVEAIHHKLPFASRRVYSPATIVVSNQAGQRAGVLEDGSVLEEIPGSKVAVVNSEKYVFLPPGDFLLTELRGTGTGTMTVELVESDGTGGGQIVTYKDVPVTPQLVAHIDEADPQPGLSLQPQGQSTEPQLREPNKVENISAQGSTYSVSAPDTAVVNSPQPSTSSDNSTLLLIGGAALVALVLVGAVGVSLSRRKCIHPQ
ncbi:MAG TPA: hypothetical protein VF914_16325 [Chloroflexia bacterium]|jgi:hypothetical protein